MFFEEQESHQSSQLDRWCRTLIQGLSRIDSSFRKDLEPAKKSMKKLQGRIAPGIIERVIAWYIEHMGDEFVPKCAQVGGFCFKFDQIKQAMENDTEPTVDHVLDIDRTLSDRLLLTHKYPVEIQAALPLLAFRTRTNWDLFYEKLQTHPVKDREAAFLHQVLECESMLFPEQWLVFLSWRFSYRPHYMGPVMILAFRADSRWFRDSFWRKWAGDWTGLPTAFDHLLVELLK